VSSGLWHGDLKAATGPLLRYLSLSLSLVVANVSVGRHGGFSISEVSIMLRPKIEQPLEYWLETVSVINSDILRPIFGIGHQR
jgi:hypothetical protein